MAWSSHLCLVLLDHLFGALFVAPLTVFYWRGTWTLLNVGFASNPGLGSWVSVLIGNVGMCTAAFLQHVFKSKLPKDNWICWLVGYHLYIYVYAFCSVNQWRGIWVCLDYYTGYGPITYACSTAVGFGFLLFIRASKTCQAPPVMLCVDRDENSFFGYSTRFNIDHKEIGNRENYILDTLFTCLILHNCVVLYWRGVWGLLDNFLYSDNIQHSTWASLVIGYSVFLLLIPWQLVCDKIYKYSYKRGGVCGWFGKVLADDILFIPANFCAVSVWRGVWMTCDIYIWPEQQAESSWLTHGVGILGLMILMCAQSTIVKGCEIDGDGDGLGNCILNIRYFRYWLSEKNRYGLSEEKNEVGPMKY